MPEAASAPDLLVEGLEHRGEGGRLLVAVPRLAVPGGQAVALRGPSGAGKSTLLHLLAGLARPVAGRIAWGGTDLAALGEDQRAAFRARHVGLVFQDPSLFEELDARGNAAVAAAFAPRADRAALRARAEEWLGRLGLGGAAGRGAARLSGGERSRVAVARALARAAPVILADEPTASLDRPTADRLIADLMAATAAVGRTLIVASHDPGLIARMDRVLSVEDGRVTEDGRG